MLADGSGGWGRGLPDGAICVIDVFLSKKKMAVIGCHKRAPKKRRRWGGQLKRYTPVKSIKNPPPPLTQGRVFIYWHPLVVPSRRFPYKQGRCEKMYFSCWEYAHCDRMSSIIDFITCTHFLLKQQLDVICMTFGFAFCKFDCRTSLECVWGKRNVLGHFCLHNGELVCDFFRFRWGWIDSWLIPRCRCLNFMINGWTVCLKCRSEFNVDVNIEKWFPRFTDSNGWHTFAD